MTDYRRPITADELIRQYDLNSLKKTKTTIYNQIKDLNSGLQSTNTNLQNFVDATTSNIEDLQDQIDGNITTWFYSGVPTLNNAPAEDWTTDTDKDNHLGDLYYDQNTGYSYRFAKTNNTYSWIKLTDSDITEALALANAAQDTADSKRRVFVTQPIPPYDVGDMWTNGNDLYRCSVTRASGSFNDADWVLATNYTDDSYARGVEAALNTYKTEVSTTYTTKSELTTATDQINGKVSALTTRTTTLEGEIVNKATKEQVSNLSIRADGIESTVSSVSTVANNALAIANGNVESVDVLYALSNSPTTAPTSGWDTEAPTWESGKYMWQKTVTTYGDSTTVESEPTCLTGATGQTGATGPQGPKGDKGDKGDQGIQGLQGLQGEKGDQGIQGPKGDTGDTGPKGDTGATGPKGDTGAQGPAGTSSYFHIAYANSADGTQDFSTSEAGARQYIGTYVDSNPTDSTTPSDYTWQLTKGIQGEKGDQGIPGTNGTNGQTSYLHIAYANSSDGVTDFSVSDSVNKSYIGQYTDFTSTDSTTPSDYSWSKIKGEDAEPAVMYHNAKGTNITTEDDTGNIELKSINSIEGQTSQVQYTGKNLLNYNDYTNQANITIDGDYITITNSSNATIYPSITFATPLEAGGYTTRVDVQSITSGKVMTLYVMDDVNDYTANHCIVQAFSSAGVKVLNKTFGDTLKRYMLVVQAGATIKLSTMLVKGLYTTETIGNFEPYVGGIPSPNPNYPQDIHVVSGDNTIDICGKNLFDKDKVTQNYYVNSSNGQLTYGGANYCASDFINVSQGNYVWGETSTTGYHLCTYDKNKQFIRAVGRSIKQPIAVAITSEEKFVRYTISTADLDTQQFEKGSTATTYEPYIGNTYPIYLGVENLFSGSLYNGQVGSNGGYTSSTNRITNISGVGVSSTAELPAGTYTLSIPNLDYCTALTKNSGGTIIDNFANSWQTLPFTFTLTQAGYLYFTGRKSDNSTITASDYQAQVEKGTKVNHTSTTPIELCKIGDYKDYIKRASGKNLYNKYTSDYIKGYFLNANGVETVSGNWGVYYIPVEPNTSYTISGSKANGGVNFCWFDGNKTFISRIGTKTNYTNMTSPSNAKYIGLSLVWDTSNGAYDNNFMLEQNTQATLYEPYGNVWCVYKNIGKVILDSTYRQSGGTTGTNAYYIGTTILGLNDNTQALSWSNMFQPCSFNNRTNGLDIIYLQNGYLQIRTANNTSLDWSDNTKRDNWLNANKPIVYYVLATPTTTEITNEELIDQLDAFEKAKLNEGANNIVVTGNLPAILDVDYWTYYKGETGTPGETGPQGKGIKATKEQYYLSTSNTTQSGGSWSDTCPAWVSGKFIWTRSHITWSDDTVSTTTPVLANGINSANSNANNALDKINNLQVGTQNILRDTKQFYNTNVDNTESGYLRGRGTVTTAEEYEDFTVVTKPSTDGSALGEWLVKDCKPGEEYTLSFWLKGDKAPRCYFYGPSGYIQVAKVTTQNGTGNSSDGNSDANAGGVPYSADEWQRVWVTWKLKDTEGTTSDKWVLIRNDNRGTIYVAGAKLEKGNIATDWSPAPADVAADIKDVNDTVDETNKDVTNLGNRTDTLETDMKNKVDDSDFTEYKQYVTKTYTTISQTEDKITIGINEATKTLVTKADYSATTSSLAEVRSYFDFASDGLTIGKSTSNTTLLLSNEKLAFKLNGAEKAYMSPNSFVLKELNTFKLGGFAFKVRANGNLALVWVGESE